jgi:sRNA-binding protein
MEQVVYVIELDRINGSADHTSANLPSLTKGQRLKVPVGGGLVYAEVIEVTKLTTEPVKWKLLARELELPGSK